MESIKDYLLSVGLKKYAPTVMLSVMGALGTLLVAHEGLLEPWGVNYIASWNAAWLATHPISGPILLIELDTTSTAAIAAVVGLITLWSRATEHHVVAPIVNPPKEAV